MAANPTRAYRFSGYQLDLAQQRLSGADGQSIALPGRAYDVLVFLIEHRERVVSKDELLKAVWPRTIVEENNLNQAVSTLRRALGDSRETPRCILTVAGRGYRFIADATEVRSLPVTEPPAPTTSTSVTPGLSMPESPVSEPATVAAATLQPEAPAPALTLGRRWVLAAAGALALAGGGGLLLSRRRPPAEPSLPRSIAVLPFKPLAPGGTNAAVELGVAETLINRLSELPGVVVSPLSSVRRFGGVEQDPLEAGRTLHVDAVLDGYLQIQQDNVRLTARLLNVSDGTALWAGRFDEPLADFFRLQDSLASQLVGALAIQLTGPAKERLLRRDTDDVEAWQFYVNGRYHLERRNEENVRRAIGFYEAAERRDPHFALAPAGLADAWAVLGVFNIEPPDAAFSRARAAAERAIVLDSGLAEAHTALGHISVQYDRDWDAGQRLYARALALKPNYAMAMMWSGMLWTMKGRPDEGLRLLHAAQSLEPMSLPYSAVIGLVQYFAHDFDAAYAQLSRIVETSPEADLARSFLAWVLLARGEAAATLRLIAGRTLKVPGSLGHAGRAYALLGNVVAARTEMDRLDALGGQGFGVSYDLALIHLALGEREPALHAIERAVVDRSQLMGYLNVDPALAPIAAEPRMRALSRRIGLG